MGLSRSAGAGATAGSILTGVSAIGTKVGAKVATSIIGGTATKVIGVAMPWIGLGLTAVQLLAPLIGRGRKKADEFVQGVENPISDRLKALYLETNSRAQAGTLTYDEAQAALDAFQSQSDEFNAAATQWEAMGGNYAKVAGQARKNVAGTYSSWQSDLSTYATSLKPADPATGAPAPAPPPPAPPTEPPGTGGATKLKKAQGAADQQGKRAKAAFGRSSTILGGASGKPTLQRPSILGY